ncbi:MAG: ABC-ATPase domain-containing protein [Nitrospira sp. SB0677_bin_15]|nr:ABC-ATPase domain-containing protein [Nitrospira sp. SB0667_bin_9]MYD32105.1 ABC-ATPase domain-containing protein [Nitrospira sp. SB0661_bin_20]MYG39340.1 ABC-ATPase domain-containing protein [Nitrospira sp. SB0677_bin_15]MYH02239.1 ABC-ATPase domain-containing protein [Nitrospira sp. SB0675_bin_23]MYJ22076.1 ABC-ATPase domain-containing protein [Nitrospira sp. SB0673_bin_12]
MHTIDDLKKLLGRIDGRGYKAYKDLQGAYAFPWFTLFIDHVQGDPFASPSRIRVRVLGTVAKLPTDLFSSRVRRVALQDFLIREVHHAIRHVCRGNRGIGKSGLVAIDVGGQEVLERTAMVVTPQWVEVRLSLGLPAQGRTILGRQAEAMLCQELSEIAERALKWERVAQEHARTFVDCVDNQESIRRQLDSLGLVAFIADGSILPRSSGASDHPLSREQVQPFRAPDSLRVSIPIPHPVSQDGGLVHSLTGCGIPKGVTLIVGGGYHGKSTVLRALERGVYPHVPEDGREYVVTTERAVKIRAEDGRSIERMDIGGFINNLPYGQDTTQFSTDNASGSTSQAASILEAIEVGTTALLLDEDTSATNFMVRDARMQALVHNEHEPITPFVDRVRELYERHGVSTVLVMGGCGDYFDVADTVIAMQDYQPRDVTEDAKRIVQEFRTQRAIETTSSLAGSTSRVPLWESLDPSRGNRDVKIDARSVDAIVYGHEVIDLSGVEQLVDVSQTRAIGYALHLASRRSMKGSLQAVVQGLAELFDNAGLDGLDPYHQGERHPGNFARPRAFEIAAALNRLRTLRIRE